MCEKLFWGESIRNFFQSGFFSGKNIKNFLKGNFEVGLKIAAGFTKFFSGKNFEAGVEKWRKKFLEKNIRNFVRASFFGKKYKNFFQGKKLRGCG